MQAASAEAAEAAVEEQDSNLESLREIQSSLKLTSPHTVLGLHEKARALAWFDLLRTIVESRVGAGADVVISKLYDMKSVGCIAKALEAYLEDDEIKVDIIVKVIRRVMFVGVRLPTIPEGQIILALKMLEKIAMTQKIDLSIWNPSEPTIPHILAFINTSSRKEDKINATLIPHEILRVLKIVLKQSTNSCSDRLADGLCSLLRNTLRLKPTEGRQLIIEITSDLCASPKFCALLAMVSKESESVMSSDDLIYSIINMGPGFFSVPSVVNDLLNIFQKLQNSCLGTYMIKAFHDPELCKSYLERPDFVDVVLKAIDVALMKPIEEDEEDELEDRDFLIEVVPSPEELKPFNNGEVFRDMMVVILDILKSAVYEENLKATSALLSTFAVFFGKNIPNKVELFDKYAETILGLLMRHPSDLEFISVGQAMLVALAKNKPAAAAAGAAEDYAHRLVLERGLLRLLVGGVPECYEAENLALGLRESNLRPALNLFLDIIRASYTPGGRRVRLDTEMILYPVLIALDNGLNGRSQKHYNPELPLKFMSLCIDTHFQLCRRELPTGLLDPSVLIFMRRLNIMPVIADFARCIPESNSSSGTSFEALEDSITILKYLIDPDGHIFARLSGCMAENARGAFAFLGMEKVDAFFIAELDRDTEFNRMMQDFALSGCCELLTNLSAKRLTMDRLTQDIAVLGKLSSLFREKEVGDGCCIS